MKPFLFLSLIDSEDALPEIGRMSPTMRDALILLGALLFVVTAVLIWAVFIRKRRHGHKHRHHTSHHEQTQTRIADAPAETGQGLHRRKHRHHRRREHRPRNPTLAETGGLPPVRDQEPPGPAQTQTQ